VTVHVLLKTNLQSIEQFLPPSRLLPLTQGNKPVKFDFFVVLSSLTLAVRTLELLQGEPTQNYAKLLLKPIKIFQKYRKKRQKRKNSTRGEKHRVNKPVKFDFFCRFEFAHACSSHSCAFAR
jgi:hypothetical protein